MQFHVPSIQTVMFFIQLMMAGYFLLTWWMNRTERAPLFFAGANIVGAVSALMFLYQAHVHLFFSSTVPILCMVGLISAHFMGVCEVMGRPKPWRTPAIVLTPVVLWSIYFAFIEPALWIRYMAVGIGVIILCLHTAWHLRAMMREAPFVSLRVLFVGVIIHAIFFALSLVSVGMTRPMGTYDSLSSTSAALAITESVLLVVAVNIAVAMLFQERAAMRLKRAAETDTLTGLMNRQSLASEFERVVEQGDKPYRPAVALLDLDGFKEVNDTLGHQWGDRLLISVSQRLQETIQGHGAVARLGGDEFAFVLNPSRADSDHSQRAQALLEALRAPFPLNGAEVRLSASVGISNVIDSRASLAEHLRRADIAMYEAKSRGRDACVYFSPLLDEAIQQATWMRAELRKAVETNDLRLVYQPKYDVSGPAPKPVGMEALLRWSHPEKGPISPSAFIPVAEQTGLIHLIGARLLMQACCEAQAMGGVAVAVNLSPAQFDSKDLVTTVANALRISGLNPACLELEITEGVYLNDTGNVRETLVELRALGVRLALDDFGTGYSSLSYLTRLPFDTLKIDRTFVRDCINRPDAQAVMASVMQLAHAIQLDVVAEGVETEEELACVKELGCSLVQGYLLAPPLERTEIEQRFIAFTGATNLKPKPRLRA